MMMWWLALLVARAAADTEPIHVMLAGDAAVLPGLAVAASSLLNGTRAPERVWLHVLTTRGDWSLVRETLRCCFVEDLTLDEKRLDVRAFDSAALFSKILEGSKIPKRLSGELNFARFVLPELFGSFARKMVYLDADVVFEGDVADLYDAALLLRTPQPIAAVPRGTQHLRLSPTLSLAARKVLAKEGVTILRDDDPLPRVADNEVDASSKASHNRRPVTSLLDFNAGVLVLHLRRWADLNLTARVLDFMRLNRELDVYTRGSNPPLVMALNDRWERLDPRWNCPAQPSSTPLAPQCVSNPGVVHLTGPDKPWLPDGLVDRRWKAKLDPTLARCLLRHANFDLARNQRAAKRRQQQGGTLELSFVLSTVLLLSVLLLALALLARRRSGPACLVASSSSASLSSSSPKVRQQQHRGGTTLPPNFGGGPTSTAKPRW